MAGPLSSIQIQRVPVERIIDLRHVILRQGLPRESAIFTGDDLPSSRHYAAIDNGRVVCCLTLHQSQWESQPAWQLRGMAADKEHQGHGIGSAMMDWMEAELLSDADASRQLWCNARVPARNFYLKLGWQIVSDIFDIPTAGPHVRMIKLIRYSD